MIAWGSPKVLAAMTAHTLLLHVSCHDSIATPRGGAPLESAVCLHKTVCYQIPVLGPHRHIFDDMAVADRGGGRWIKHGDTLCSDTALTGPCSHPPQPHSWQPGSR